MIHKKKLEQSFVEEYDPVTDTASLTVFHEIDLSLASFDKVIWRGFNAVMNVFPVL